MKSIKFTESNADKINTILAEVNGRAGDHVYRSYEDLAADAGNVIKKIETILGGKKYCVGAKFSVESGNSVKSAYRYTRIGTRISLECRATGWFVTNMQRVDIWAKGGESQIELTPAHHDQAVTVLKRGYSIVVPIS